MCRRAAGADVRADHDPLDLRKDLVDPPVAGAQACSAGTSSPLMTIVSRNKSGASRKLIGTKAMLISATQIIHARAILLRCGQSFWR